MIDTIRVRDGSLGEISPEIITLSRKFQVLESGRCNVVDGWKNRSSQSVFVSSNRRSGKINGVSLSKTLAHPFNFSIRAV